MLFTVSENLLDIADIAARFLFSAEPELFSYDKKSFDKKVRAHDFLILRTICLDLLSRSGMNTSDKKTEIRIITNIAPKIGLEKSDVINPVYQVELICLQFR